MPKTRIWLAHHLELHLDKSGECWLWTGRTNTINGYVYGRFTLDGNRFYAHRLAYELWIGPIAPGCTVSQVCGHSLCCRPEHLVSG